VKEFILPVRVYYEDTDTGGVVYYANYLKFMERARTEWLRSKGIEQDTLIDKHDIIFAVRSAHVEYLKPARFNQLLDVTVAVAKSGKASVTFEQKITPADDRNVTFCEGRVKVACLQASTLRPVPIPAAINLEMN
jgi:acyl-CoA thioester hydrolase